MLSVLLTSTARTSCMCYTWVHTVSDLCSVFCRPVQPEHRVWVTREYTQCQTFAQCFVNHFSLHVSTQYLTCAQCFVDQHSQNIVYGLQVSTHNIILLLLHVSNKSVVLLPQWVTCEHRQLADTQPQRRVSANMWVHTILGLCSAFSRPVQLGRRLWVTCEYTHKPLLSV